MPAIVFPVLLSLLMVATVTLTLMAAKNVLILTNLVSIVYLVPVLISARWGRTPAVVCACAGGTAAAYFFFPPIYSFEIGDTQDIANLAVFLIVAFMASHYTERLQRESDELRRSRKEILDLYSFSRQLATCFTVQDLIAATDDYLSKTLGHRAVLINFGEAEQERSAGFVPNPVRREAAVMTAAGAEATRAIYDADTQKDWLVRVIQVGGTGYAAIVDLGRGTHRDLAAVSQRVDAAIEEVAATVGRLDVAKAIEEARLKSQAGALRDALIGSLSHELRTPLASIIGSASVLDQMPAVRKNQGIHALVEAVRDQAARLDGDIRNLLNAARITTRGIQPHLEFTDPTDIISAAVTQKSPQLAGHQVELSVAPNLPLVKVNSVLVEQAFGHLLENAAKYSPAGSTIRISARADEDRVVLSVTDQGVGLTSDEKRRLGQRSFRGVRHLNRIPGTGLGLWIADTFVTANGGTLDAESPGPGGGTTVSIRLAAAENEDGEGVAEALL